MAIVESDIQKAQSGRVNADSEDIEFAKRVVSALLVIFECEQMSDHCMVKYAWPIRKLMEIKQVESEKLHEMKLLLDN